MKNKIKNTISSKFSGGGRSSNIELFRIITMLVIVAHHYVVNSGLLTIVQEQQTLKSKDIFLLLFGWVVKQA